MKTLIAIPCMDTVHTLFFDAMLRLRFPADTQVVTSKSSLIYDARNMLARLAVEQDFDRVLWLDSDITFEPDLVERLSAAMDEGREFVTGLYFTRRAPIKPCVYEHCGMIVGSGGRPRPIADSFTDIPEHVFQVAAAGFGGCMVSVDLIRRIAEKYGLPFSPITGFGEDLSFCLRATELGVPLWCDPSIRLGHVGQVIFDQNAWTASRR